EESEKVDLKAATKEYEHLRKSVFPTLRLDLLHGRMKPEEKDEVMRKFVAGETNVLVSTTVIEVGVDVPNASVMVIENAERFGLSQLHQLRGRVGRGADQSYCILLSNASSFTQRLRARDVDDQRQEIHAAQLRLDTMMATTDGFRIAEVDLKLRGPGEFFGTRQSGLPALRLANLVDDADLVAQARSLAFDLVAHDPQLSAADHLPIKNHFETYFRNLLHLAHVS
ncbi:MAG: DNA helicase RecG, partial [Ignavibacteriales bacterium]|nr:DNA helicase RecG [Ignavibacteriales bacterium]